MIQFPPGVGDDKGPVITGTGTGVGNTNPGVGNEIAVPFGRPPVGESFFPPVPNIQPPPPSNPDGPNIQPPPPIQRGCTSCGELEHPTGGTGGDTGVGVGIGNNLGEGGSTPGSLVDVITAAAKKWPWWLWVLLAAGVKVTYDAVNEK